MGWRNIVVLVHVLVACQVYGASVPNFSFNARYNKVYNVYGLVKEMESYEAQFFRLNERIDFKPIYGDLLNRVLSYSDENIRNTTDVDKKVLAWLYTAILSKIVSMQTEKEPALLTDVRNHFPIVERHIETYSHQLIHSYKEDYRHNMQLKIEEARNYISHSVLPKIDKYFHMLEGELDYLLDEVQERKEQAKRDKEAWERYGKQLGKSMELHLILGVLNSIGTVVGFMGPLGAAAGMGMWMW